MSARVEGFQERLVTIHGEQDNLREGVRQVIRRMQGAPHLQEHMHFVYKIELPMGAWNGENNEPQNPHSPLMPYEVAQVWGRHVADMRRVMCGTVTGKEAIPQLWIPIWLHSTYGYCTEKEPHAW
eukprot:g8108.t1